MADGVWKGVYPLISGRSCQFLINKFFDLSALSMRKGRDGGKKRTFIEATIVITTRPPKRRPTGMMTARAKSNKSLDIFSNRVL